MIPSYVGRAIRHCRSSFPFQLGERGGDVARVVELEQLPRGARRCRRWRPLPRYPASRDQSADRRAGVPGSAPDGRQPRPRRARRPMPRHDALCVPATATVSSTSSQPSRLPSITGVRSMNRRSASHSVPVASSNTERSLFPGGGRMGHEGERAAAQIQLRALTHQHRGRHHRGAVGELRPRSRADPPGTVAAHGERDPAWRARRMGRSATNAAWPNRWSGCTWLAITKRIGRAVTCRTDACRRAPARAQPPVSITATASSPSTNSDVRDVSEIFKRRELCTPRCTKTPGAISVTGSGVAAADRDVASPVATTRLPEASASASRRFRARYLRARLHSVQTDRLIAAGDPVEARAAHVRQGEIRAGDVGTGEVGAGQLAARQVRPRRDWRP